MKGIPSDSIKQESIWIDFLDGDDACFTLIYKKYIGMLFQYGIQFTDDDEVVKDAIQDVFVRIYHNRNQLNRDIHVKFYLFKALKNCLYNVFKRETFFEKVGQQDLTNHLDQSTDHENLSEVEQNERKQIVTELLNRLTDRQREAIYYRFIEELSMEEISILMEMNTQSVQNIIQRSLKKLRESTSYLNQYFEK